MNKLRKLAFEKRTVARKTANGQIQIEGLKIHFPCASLQQIKKSHVLDTLTESTYLNKPVVSVDQNILFGELAILRYLEKDGWNGVWVDAFHSSRNKDALWSGMPPKGVAPPLPPVVSDKFKLIKEKNEGKLSGFFDIFAWKGDGNNFLFLEYKGKDDSTNDNELSWINAAISAGVKPEQLCIVGYDLPI